nr:AAA family ATPase [Arthrobacter pigmenti]
MAIFINGTVGAGKTTAAEALGRMLEHKGVAHAIIDLDEIRRAWPAPSGDRFNHELELTNLTSLVANYAATGIETFVLAGVLEDERETPRYRHAVGGRRLLIARITATEAIRKARIRARHSEDPEGEAWHLHRTVELENILEHEQLDDVVIDSTSATPAGIAEQVWNAARALRSQSAESSGTQAQ